MEGSQRRQLLVSKGWIQAVVLVILCGFFILGLLAYRTYMAHPPVPAARRRCAGPRPLHRPRHLRRASRSSCTTASWSTGRRSATAPTSGPTSPPTTCAARRISSSAPTAAAALGLRGAQDDRGLPHQPLRQAHEDADADRAAGPGLPRARAVLQPLLLRPDDRARPAAQRDHRPHAAAPADRVLRLDGVGGVDRPPRPRLLLHQQLAARAARRQQADRRRDRVVGAVADRAAGRHRPAVRRLRALGAQAGLARPRAGHAVASARPATSRSRPAQRATRVVLLRDGGAVPAPDARRRRRRSTTAPRSTASSASTWRRSSPTT